MPRKTVEPITRDFPPILRKPLTEEEVRQAWHDAAVREQDPFSYPRGPKVKAGGPYSRAENQAVMQRVERDTETWKPYKGLTEETMNIWFDIKLELQDCDNTTQGELNA